MAFNLIKKIPSINFVGFRFIAYIMSTVVFLLAIGAIFFNNGLNYGVDFAGGAMVQVEFSQGVQDEKVKQALNPLKIPGLVVQQIGLENTEYLVRFSSTDNTQEYRDVIIDTLNAQMPEANASIQRLEMVGPKVGEDLQNAALEALFYAVLSIVVYISGRFEHRWLLAGGMALALGLLSYGLEIFGLGRIWQVSLGMALTLGICFVLRLNFALGAIIALIHDVGITVGILTFLGKEIDLNIVAALLTIVGYSLNDTIVNYDRIRENFKAQDEENPAPIGEIINSSINQTLGRTIMTSGTTLAAVLSLYILGGGVINDFAFTMLLGVVIGTFSSIFVASPLLMALGDEKLYISRFHKKEEEHEKPGEHGMV